MDFNKAKRFRFSIGSGGFAGAVLGRENGEHDVVAVLFEFEDDLDAGDFVGDAKIYGRG